MRHSWILLALPLMFGCASPPLPHQPTYETTYDCSVSETRGALRLRADPDSVGWIELIDGVSTQANLSLRDDEHRNRFLLSGFSGQDFDRPILFFDYPADLKPDEDAGYTIKGRPLEHFFGGARGGGGFVRRRVASNVFLSLNWKEVQTLQRDGEMVVFLYDRTGAALKTLHISKAHFDQIERLLKNMFSQVLVRETNKEHLCEAYTQEFHNDIIVID